MTLRGIGTFPTRIAALRPTFVGAGVAYTRRMQRRTERSIRWHLAILALAVAVPLLAILAWGFWSELAQQRQSARELALRIASSVAEDFQRSNGRAEELLARMARRPEIRVAGKDGCDPLFAIVDFFPQYLNLQLYGPSGDLVCSAAPQPGDVEKARFAEQWIDEFLRSRKPLPRDPVLLPIAGQWLSIVFHPVEESGITGGILALVQSVDFGLDAYPPGTIVTIIDEEGRIVARSTDDGAKWVARDVRDTDIVKATLLHDDGRAQATGVDGTLRQYGFTRVKGSRWHVYVGIPAGVAMAAVRTLLLRGIAAGAFVIAVVVFLSFRLSRSIERPLEQLAAAAQRIEDAGFSSTVPVGGPREVAVVGAAFQSMVTRRAEAEAALVVSRNELEALSRRLVDVQEEERTRIAREIHDELGQLLTALKMDVGGLIDAVHGRADLQPMIARIRLALEETVSSTRRIAAELRPPALDDFGFLAAIESDVLRFEERTGIECELSVPLVPPSLQPIVETTAYRIVQEALTNVARHANAARVEIRLRIHGDEILVDVRDDGTGISSDTARRPRGLGIIGMRERARQIGGSLEVEGIEGKGTIVSLRLPVVAEAMA